MRSHSKATHNFGWTVFLLTLYIISYIMPEVIVALKDVVVRPPVDDGVLGPVEQLVRSRIRHLSREPVAPSFNGEKGLLVHS